MSNNSPMPPGNYNNNNNINGNQGIYNGQGSNNMLNTNIIDMFMMKFFMMQDSKTELTLWSIIGILAFQNLHEIKKIVSEFFSWIKIEVLTWIKENMLLLWSIIKDKYFKKDIVNDIDDNDMDIDDSINIEDNDSNNDTDADISVNKLELTITKDRNSAKTQTDILAFINYLIQRNLYLRYIVDIHRESGDKYSSVEGHYLMNPINVELDNDLTVTFTESLYTKVEVSIHDANTIKIQDIHIISDTDTTNSTNNNSSTINNNSNNNNSDNEKFKLKWDISLTYISHNDFGKKFAQYAEKRFGKNPIWSLYTQTVTHNLINMTGFPNEYGLNNDLNNFYQRFYSIYFANSIFISLFYYLLIRGNKAKLINFLMLPEGIKSVKIMGITFSNTIPINDKEIGILKRLTESPVGMNNIMLSKNWYPCFEKYLTYNQIKQDPMIIKTFIEKLKITNMEYSDDEINDNDNDKVIINKMVNKVRENSVVTKSSSATQDSHKKYSFIFTSNTLSKSEIYTRSQNFLNSIRLDYYKNLKMPKAFKEIKIFTIKIKYREESITKPNPEYAIWEKEQQEKLQLYNKAENEWKTEYMKVVENYKRKIENDKQLSGNDNLTSGKQLLNANDNDNNNGNNGINGINGINNNSNSINGNNNTTINGSDSNNNFRNNGNNGNNGNNDNNGNNGNNGNNNNNGNNGNNYNCDINDNKRNYLDNIFDIPDIRNEFEMNEIERFCHENPRPKMPKIVSAPVKNLVIIKNIPELVVKQVGQTYKPIDYLYMRSKAKKQLQAILNNFTSNSEIYQKMGILHKMCLMIHGSPGTGKTTAIRAIASHLQRDIYYLDLNGIIANSHLQLIFDYLMSNCGGRGVVVMEDIDCMTPIVLSRESKIVADYSNETKDKIVPAISNPSVNFAKANNSSVSNFAGGIENGIVESQNTEELTLSYLLNLLDGTISIEDLVVIMTTNHPEKLDKALYRPGRVDAQLEFQNCNDEMIKIIYETMFERKLNPETAKKLVNDKFTPAEIIFHFLPKIYQVDETDDEICAPFL